MKKLILHSMCDKRNLCFLYLGFLFQTLFSIIQHSFAYPVCAYLFQCFFSSFRFPGFAVEFLQISLLFHINLHIRFVHISSNVSFHLDFLVLQLNFFEWFSNSFWFPVFAVIILLFNRNCSPEYCLQSKSCQKMCHLLCCCLSSLLVILQKVCFNIWVVIAMVLYSSKLKYLQIRGVKSKMTASTVCYLLFFVALFNWQLPQFWSLTYLRICYFSTRIVFPFILKRKCIKYLKIEKHYFSSMFEFYGAYVK